MGKGYTGFGPVAGAGDEPLELTRGSKVVGILAPTPNGKQCLITDQRLVYSHGQKLEEATQDLASLIGTKEV